MTSTHKMVIEDTDLHEGWTYDFDATSDSMAIGTAKAMAKQFATCRWFKRIILWNTNDPVTPICSVYIHVEVETKVVIND